MKESMAGISTMYSFLQNPQFSLFFLKILWENKPSNSKNLEQIIVGSQLVLAAFSGLNAFIYKLALE